MQSCKHMIRGWYDLHEVFFDDRLMFDQCNRHIFEYYSLCFEFFSEIMVDNFTIILCSDTCEYLSLCFRDTESIECLFDRIRHIIPGFLVTRSFRFPEVIYGIQIEIFE